MKILASLLLASTVSAATARLPVAELPPCRGSAPAAPRGWQTIAVPGDVVRFRIPPGMRKNDDPKVFCIHGCEGWARGTFTVTVSHGLWDASSFDEAEWSTACAVRNSKQTVVRMPGKDGKARHVLVWPVNDGPTQSTNDAIVNVSWTDAADERDAAAVIASVTR